MWQTCHLVLLCKELLCPDSHRVLPGVPGKLKWVFILLAVTKAVVGSGESSGSPVYLHENQELERFTGRISVAQRDCEGL